MCGFSTKGRSPVEPLPLLLKREVLPDDCDFSGVNAVVGVDVVEIHTRCVLAHIHLYTVGNVAVGCGIEQGVHTGTVQIEHLDDHVGIIPVQNEFNVGEFADWVWVSKDRNFVVTLDFTRSDGSRQQRVSCIEASEEAALVKRFVERAHGTVEGRHAGGTCRKVTSQSAVGKNVQVTYGVVDTHVVDDRLWNSADFLGTGYRCGIWTHTA